jgi:hypothetical protein
MTYSKRVMGVTGYRGLRGGEKLEERKRDKREMRPRREWTTSLKEREREAKGRVWIMKDILNSHEEDGDVVKKGNERNREQKTKLSLYHRYFQGKLT